LLARTYYQLRWGLGICAAAFPLILICGERLIHRGPLPLSISAYYHTGMRTVWTGSLTVMALCLILYKGFSKGENLLLTIAGIGVTGVIVFPTGYDVGSTDGTGFTAPLAHGISALLAFGSMGLVAVFLGPDTLDLVGDGRTRCRYRRAYGCLGVSMIGLPILAGVILHLIGTSATYWVEASAVAVFAVYWLVKTTEFRATKAETRAITGRLPRAPGAVEPAALGQLPSDGGATSPAQAD
jgi:hypothetical protein